jgi:hypothetical protein
MYRDTKNVGREMYVYTGNNWSHRNSNKRFEENFVSHTRKTYNRSTTTDSCTRNITRNTESTAACNLKPGPWGSPLAQEKHQEEQTGGRRQQKQHNNNYYNHHHHHHPKTHIAED